jgi:hypothetical protein
MYSPDILPQSYSLWSSTTTTKTSSSSSPPPPPPPPPSQGGLHRNSRTSSSNLPLKLQFNDIHIRKPYPDIYHKWSKRMQYFLSQLKVLNLKINSSKLLVNISSKARPETCDKQNKFLNILQNKAITMNSKSGPI